MLGVVNRKQTGKGILVRRALLEEAGAIKTKQKLVTSYSG
jgi:hypothetical protein